MKKCVGNLGAEVYTGIPGRLIYRKGSVVVAIRKPREVPGNKASEALVLPKIKTRAIPGQIIH
jgi:hypothetical protein